jgi:hypothetical protein
MAWKLVHRAMKGQWAEISCQIMTVRLCNIMRRMRDLTARAPSESIAGNCLEMSNGHWKHRECFSVTFWCHKLGVHGRAAAFPSALKMDIRGLHRKGLSFDLKLKSALGDKNDGRCAGVWSSMTIDAIAVARGLQEVPEGDADPLTLAAAEDRIASEREGHSGNRW